MCEKNEKKQTYEQLKETWDRAREMIKHENELINQRLSWMFAAQAFLFAAFLIGVKAAVDPDIQDTLDRILMVFFLLPVIYLGLFSSLTSYRMVRDANKQRKFAESYWMRLSRKILQLPELQEDSTDRQFEKKIFSIGFPEHIQGENLTTECFGLLSKLPGAELFTRDHTFPKVFSYTWIVMFVLWLVLILKLLYMVVINCCLSA